MTRPTSWQPAFTEQLGEDSCAPNDSAHYLVDEQQPALVCYPSTIDELSRTLTLAAQFELAVIPVGHGSNLGVGCPPSAYDLAVSTRRMNRVLAHEAADLTVTVEAGVTLAELNLQLAVVGQHLPLDPPHPESATIGAIIATDGNGPMRYSQGKVRDLLIGVKVVLADGTIIKGGGQVVKNVAGYDLMKLFTGSFGTLAVIAEASFKLRPLPPRQALVGIGRRDLSEAIELCLELQDLAIEPYSLQAADDSAGRALGTAGAAALIGFAGSEVEIGSQIDLLRATNADLIVFEEAEQQSLYRMARDFPCAASPQWLARISVLPSRLRALTDSLSRPTEGASLEIVAQPGNGVVWIKFGSDDATSSNALAQAVRKAAAHQQGYAVFTTMPSAAKATIDPWGKIPAAELQGRIQASLDPRHRLSPGRLPLPLGEESRL